MIVLLIVLFLLLNIVDLVLTGVAFNLGGYELNPFFASLSLGWRWIAKMGIVMLISGWLLWKRKIKPAIFGCVATGSVVIWNTLQILAVYK